MTAVLLPPPRVAARHPAVRAAVLLLLAGPPSVAWWGEPESGPLRLRVLGLLLAAVVALAWDDRAHLLTASTPVGLPAVRRGRVLAVGGLAAAAFAVGCAVVPREAPVAALALQSGALSALLLAVVGWFGRDGDPVLALPLPALLISLLVLSRLPDRVGVLHADPGSPGWPDERLRWWVLLVAGVLVTLRLHRDPATRRLARGPGTTRGRDRPATPGPGLVPGGGAS